MNGFSYYTYKDDQNDGYNLCSRSSESFPIEVNCAGLMSLEHPFATYNERGREDFYLMYLIEGVLNIEIGESSAAARSGDFIIFPPKYKYGYKNNGGAVSYYFVHFTGSYADTLLSSLNISKMPCIRHAGMNKAACDVLNSIFASYIREDKYAELLRGAYLEALLVLLVSSENNSNSRIDTSVAYINAFYTEDISVPKLAAMDNLSVSRYNTVFKGLMGVSPVKYILRLRMNHAASLLNGTNIPVGIIGESVGYSDKHFFSKIFKKHFGLSPSEYRLKRI